MERKPLCLFPADRGRCCVRCLFLPFFFFFFVVQVRSIARASTTGHGTNIITGVAVGMKSTFVPVVAVSVAVVSAYVRRSNFLLGCVVAFVCPRVLGTLCIWG